ncbi:unnamed protein product [Cuscuta epithymum]|uniref:Uncharacterized protein n=1 Tax=Cuscuta epithymum TaxID=186058 RepID=A0AAV0EPH8_9ASTE|nr:unnamed protein product [Cuscuta epithymum]
MVMEVTNPLKKTTWVLPLVLTSSVIIFILILLSANPFQGDLANTRKAPDLVEPELRPSDTPPSPRIPRLAYLISGSNGDGERLKRTLKALYHPLNQYVLHLDLEAPAEERVELVRFVRSEALFVEVGNVRVVEKSNLVTYRGPTMVTNTLHAAAILLKHGGDWDWFINLSASDYPLITQDDMLHTLSTIPRDLNFIDHSSDLGWKEEYRAKPLIVDPAFYSQNKSDLIWLAEKRSVPSTYKLFTGSAWMMLSRPFVEYCIWGWDNLPRILLMYYANFVSSPEGYFHTVICNADKFKNTTVNHDLHYISWDDPPQQHPHYITSDDYPKMVESNAAFARKFDRNGTLLDKIDSEFLGRKPGGYVPGSWFDGRDTNTNASVYTTANITLLRPGPGAKRLNNLISALLMDKDFDNKHCV